MLLLIYTGSIGTLLFIFMFFVILLKEKSEERNWIYMLSSNGLACCNVSIIVHFQLPLIRLHTFTTVYKLAGFCIPAIMETVPSRAPVIEQQELRRYNHFKV